MQPRRGPGTTVTAAIGQPPRDELPNMEHAIAARGHGARPALGRRHRSRRCGRASGGGGGGGDAVGPCVHERHAIDCLSMSLLHATRRRPRTNATSADATSAAARSRGGVPHTEVVVAADARTERAVGR